MKKDSALQSAFVNPRIFLAAVLGSGALLLAVLGIGAENINSILAYGGADINLITGAEVSPRVTQSTSAVWAHGNTIVTVYADSSGDTLSPISYCGVSTSTDGGSTFTRMPEKFNTGGACFGEPDVIYSVRAGTWFTSNLAGRCGGNGVGMWTSPNGLTWSNGACVFSGSNADLPTSWVDNNAASAFYGRQYVAFNDFAIASGAVRVARSTDDGATWSAPVTVFSGSPFRRSVKITGSLGNDGTVFIETMNEGGGGLSMRQNFIHRSTDGGVTWSAAISQGAAFAAAGRRTCGDNGYFACMYNAPNGYWRHMGWGQPGVGPGGVVHYAYSGGAPSDQGNIYYIRSTDGGMTWSSPLLMNTDATTRAQWGASLSVNAAGLLFVSWYDERNTVDDSLERFGRASFDNGLTWDAEMPVSDVIFPKPLQPDPNVTSSYAGIHDFATFSDDGNGDTAFHAWTDGRVAIAGSPQQDVFLDKIDLSACVPGFWTIRASYPVAIESPAVASDGNFVYSAAGFAAGASNGVFRYDPSTNTWIALASIPTALYATRAVYAPNTNSVYVFGGLDGASVLNTTYRYNIGTDTWSTGAPMPEGRFFPNIVYYAATGKIYVIGGFNPSSVEANQTWEYDPVANTWNTSRANIPTPMGGSGTAVIGRFIHLVGSWNGGAGSTVHNRYDIINNSWSGSFASPPVPIYEPAASTIGGDIYLVGGGNPFKAESAGRSAAGLTSPATSYNSTYIYNVAADIWTTGPNTNVPHSFTGGAAYGGNFLVVAGYNGSADTNTVESLTIVCPNSSCPLLFAQDFDGVTPPALPAGWSADQGTNAGGFPQWVTSNSGTPPPAADSPPNAAYTVDPNNLLDNRLYSTLLNYGAGAQLSFRHNFDLEEANGTTAYDAGVLEININGGGWMDITAAGGNFVTGAYNHPTIATCCSNPLLPSRPNWSGISGGFITTVVNLPAAGVGQSVRLRWRMGSDDSVSHTGWRVDSVTINATCPPVPVSAVSSKMHGGAGTFVINLPLSGTPGVECRNTGGNHRVDITFANAVSVGGAAVTSGVGNVTGFSPFGNVISVFITGVTNVQTLTITLSNVSDGANTGNLMIPMSILHGDSSGNRSVNASDVSQTKSRIGQVLSSANFRSDINANGNINASDVSIVKTNVGTALP